MTSIHLRRLQTGLGRLPGPSVFALLSCIVLLLCGCSKNDASLTTAANSKTFDSAPADVKEKWQTAAASAAKSDHLGAVTNLASLFSKQELTPGQLSALEQAWADIGNRAFQAANEGDKRALEAVNAIRTCDAAKGKGIR